MRSISMVVACTLLASFAAPVHGADEITPEGRRLAEVLDSMDVEHHWPAGVHVHWETGIPDGKPGHIAIVRPSRKSRALVREEGPQVIQAGATNYASTSLERGFAGHPSAWKKREVRFYAHAIDGGNRGG